MSSSAGSVATAAVANTTSHLEERLTAFISGVIEPMGYEVIAIDVLQHRNKTLRVYIDFITPVPDVSIGIEDCVKVTHALDEPLEALAAAESALANPYELEVSSPGAERPLRRPKDFQRFSGRRVRVNTFRPLEATEIENTEYLAKNAKQKSFLGFLKGLAGERDAQKIELVIPSATKPPKKGAKISAKRAAEQTNPTGPAVKIPLKLVSKAHLDPIFEFSDSAPTPIDAQETKEFQS